MAVPENCWGAELSIWLGVAGKKEAARGPAGKLVLACVLTPAVCTVRMKLFWSEAAEIFQEVGGFLGS